MWDPYSEFQTETLPNGLTVHAAHWPGRPQAIGFVVHTGADQDPKGQEGLAHFVEHLVAENIPGKGNPEALFRKCGGSVNFGRTSWCATEFNFFVPNDEDLLMRAFALFGGMLFSSKIRKRIQKERKVVMSEFHRMYPLKMTLDLDQRERRSLYKGTPLERMTLPIGGMPRTINGLTQKAVQSFYETHYTPTNVSIVGVGGRPSAELFQMIADSPLGRQKSGRRTHTDVLTDVGMPLEKCQTESLSKLLPGSGRKVGAYKTVIRMPGTYSPELIRILCSMLETELFHEIRGRRAWEYGVDCHRWSLPYAHQVEIECEALPVNALKAVDDIVSQCIETLWRKRKLLATAKAQIIAGISLHDTNMQEVRDGAMEDLIYRNRVVSTKEQVDALRKVTPEDLHDALQWFRPEQRWVRLIYP